MIPPKKPDDKFSYADYLSWPDEERWELIEGDAWDMSPAPNTDHQRISMKLSNEIYNFLKGKPCEVFAAPCDVRLSDALETVGEETFTVVQPDLLVICDPSKIDQRRNT